MSASWNQLIPQILLLLVSCGVIDTKTPGPTSTPPVPIDALPKDIRHVDLRGENATERVELLKAVDLELVCSWTSDGNKLLNITGHWTKDGSEIGNSSITVQPEKEQFTLRRTFSIQNESDLGNYSCVFGTEARVLFILAVPQMGEKREKPIVGYVGDFMVVQCKLDDAKPEPRSWKWSRVNGSEKEPIDPEAQPRRYKMKTDGRKTKLVLHNLTEADAGVYACGAEFPIGTSYSTVELKIISLWEPLKVFLGILVEVIVLVAVILLYERSQSQKTCAAENGPSSEQRNAQTQEKQNDHEGGLAVRQRKV